jgi:hypothetical protein
MASFDFGNQTAYKFALAKAIDGAGAENTAAIDTAGFESVAVGVSCGLSNINATSGVPSIAITFRESNDTNISNSTVTTRGADAQSLVASNSVAWASIAPTKRYLFATLTPSAAVAANVHVFGALGNPHESPTK